MVVAVDSPQEVVAVDSETEEAVVALPPEAVAVDLETEVAVVALRPEAEVGSHQEAEASELLYFNQVERSTLLTPR